MVIKLAFTVYPLLVLFIDIETKSEFIKSNHVTLLDIVQIFTQLPAQIATI